LFPYVFDQHATKEYVVGPRIIHFVMSVHPWRIEFPVQFKKKTGWTQWSV